MFFVGGIGLDRASDVEVDELESRQACCAESLSPATVASTRQVARAETPESAVRYLINQTLRRRFVP